MVDILTRYAVAVPLPDKSANQVSSAIKRNVLNDRLLGSPALVVSDNGLEFSNATIARLFRRNGIKQAFTTPYNPKGNGSTERLNRTIMSLLRAALTPGIEWDNMINSIMKIYNHCPHSSTGISPYEAITGRPPKHPQLLPDTRAKLTAPTDGISVNEASLPGTNARLRNRLGTRKNFDEAWEEAEREWQNQLAHQFGALHDAHVSTQHARHAQINKNRTTPVFKVGDLVMLKDIHRPLGVDGKLRRPYLGPWQVADVHHNNTLTLTDLEGHVLPRRIPLDQIKSLYTTPSKHQGWEDVTTQVT